MCGACAGVTSGAAVNGAVYLVLVLAKALAAVGLVRNVGASNDGAGRCCGAANCTGYTCDGDYAVLVSCLMLGG